MSLTLFEQGLEEFMKKVEQVKNDKLKAKILELENKLKG